MNVSMTPWQSWLADFYLLSAILLAVALAAMNSLRQPVHRMSVAWAATLALVGLGLILAMPGWPKVRLVPPTWNVLADTAPARPAATPAEVGWPWSDVLSPGQTVSGGVRIGLPSSRAPAASGSLAPIPWSVGDALAGLLRAFFVGSALCGLWLVLGAIEAAWICRRAMPAPHELQSVLRTVVEPRQRMPRLVLSHRVGNAVALGVTRPTILWPAVLAHPTDQSGLRAVLAHEWAHIRNRDLWLLAIVRGLLVFLYAHPLYWCLRRAIRRNQEILADAVAAKGQGMQYAMDLVSWMRQLVDLYPLPVASALTMWGKTSELSLRVDVLTDEETTVLVEPSSRRRWAAIIGVGLLAIGLSTLTLRGGRAETVPEVPVQHTAASTGLAPP